MYKLLTTTAIAVTLMSTTAHAGSDFDYDKRLAKHEARLDAGKWSGFDVAGDGWETCIPHVCFIGEDTLPAGTLKPVVKNARDLLAASKAQPASVLVASNDNSFVYLKSPFIEELAEQNGVDYERMMEVMWSNPDVTWAETMQIETAKIAQIATIMDLDVKDGVDVSALEAAIAALEADAETNATTIATLNNAISDLKAQAKIDAAEIADLKISVAEWKALAETIEEVKKTAYANGVASTQPQIDMLQTTVDNLAAERDTLKFEISTLEVKLSIVEKHLANRDAEVEGLKETIERRDATITELDGKFQAALDKQTEITDTKNGIIDELQETLEGMSKSYADVLEQRAALITEVADLKGQLEDKQTMINELINARDALQEQVDAIDDSLIYSQDDLDAAVGDVTLIAVNSNDHLVDWVWKLDTNGNIIGLTNGKVKLSNGVIYNLDDQLNALFDAAYNLGFEAGQPSLLDTLAFAQSYVGVAKEHAIKGFENGVRGDNYTTLSDDALAIKADGLTRYNDLWIAVDSAEFQASILDEIADEIELALEKSYSDGYNEGYEAGYEDGFRDGVASVN